MENKERLKKELRQLLIRALAGESVTKSLIWIGRNFSTAEVDAVIDEILPDKD